VELIGKRVVDGVDVGVDEEFFVGTVSRGNFQGCRGLLGAGEIARCDGDDGGALAPLHGGNDFLETDGGGAKHSPAKFVGHDGNDNGRKCEP